MRLLRSKYLTSDRCQNNHRMCVINLRYEFGQVVNQWRIRAPSCRNHLNSCHFQIKWFLYSATYFYILILHISDPTQSIYSKWFILRAPAHFPIDTHPTKMDELNKHTVSHQFLTPSMESKEWMPNQPPAIHYQFTLFIGISLEKPLLKMERERERARVCVRILFVRLIYK